MHAIAHIKIKAAVVIAFSCGLFSIVGWPWVLPWEPEGALTVVLHDRPAIVMFTLVGFSLIVTIVGFLVGTPYGREIGLIAVPAGLCTWSFMTGRIDRLLLIHHELPDRLGLFRWLAADVLVWYVPIVVSYLLLFCVAKMKADRSSLSNDVLDDKVKAERQRNDRIANILFSSASLRRMAAFIFGCVASMLLLKILAQSGHVRLPDQPDVVLGTVPARGQIIFSVAAAFGVATFAAHQVFRARLWSFLPIPGAVALTVYLSAAQEGVIQIAAQHGTTFMPASLTHFLILPVQYVGIGTMATIAGYWFSIRALHTRQEARNVVSN